MAGEAWLVKVPADLAAMIESAEDNAEIGVVRKEIAQETNPKGKKPRYHLEINERTSAKYESTLPPGSCPRPRKADFEFSDVGLEEAIFSESFKEGEAAEPAVRIQKKITNHAHFIHDSSDPWLPSFTNIRYIFVTFDGCSYQALKIEKKQKADEAVPKDAVRTHDPRRDKTWMPGNKDNLKAAKKTVTEKKTRYDVTDEEIRKRLLARFDAHEYYSLDNLVDLENLPKNAIVNILREIGEQARHRGFMRWRLKQEYRS
eukprot:m.51999 g.51999  ORF g.51999 m.51999 type:complete len:259 (-) comp10766_c0_seq4:2731-3507(-)